MFLFFLWVSASGLAYEPVIILFGGPGTGKGFFSQSMIDFRGYHHICAGDIVRKEIELQTPLGQKIKEAISKGDHIVSKEMDQIIENEVKRTVKLGGPIILDGFVHTESDWKDLCKLIDFLELRSRVLILQLYANDATCEKRILNRLVCSKCNRIYNMEYDAPKIDGKCDICEETLKKRINDAPEIIQKRIQKSRLESLSVIQKATNEFPYIYFDTDKPMIECLEFYFYLADRAANYSENSHQLVKAAIDYLDPK